jgi:hypothetical protein
MKKFILLGLIPIIFTGCGTLGGGADYTYNHVDKDGASCSIEVGSMRSLQGVGVTISNDCTLTANAEAAKSNGDMVKVLGAAIGKIPSISLPLPVVP